MNYPMCPACRRADVDVRLSRDAREPCPHCGATLVEPLRTCCMPDCDKRLSVIEELPLCRDCGIKVALVHLSDAARYDAVMAERRRQQEQAREDRRYGRADASVVYYIRLDAERIKIGFTANLKARLSDLRVHPTALLACEPGGREVERGRHEQFAAERISSRLEDFAPSDRLTAWIEGVKAEHGIPRWATLPDTKRVVRKGA